LNVLFEGRASKREKSCADSRPPSIIIPYIPMLADIWEESLLFGTIFPLLNVQQIIKGGNRS